MGCGRVSNLLSAYLDRELTGADMLAVRRHLAGCAACCAEYEALAQVRRLLGALPAVEPRPGSQERFLRALTVTGRLATRRRAVRWQAPQAPRFWILAHHRPRWSLWAGVACAALAGSLLLTGLSRPRPPDAVVAMIRPDSGPDESTGGFVPALAADFWARDRFGNTWDERPERVPGYQFVGLWQGR